jgi:hypothetical protein
MRGNLAFLLIPWRKNGCFDTVLASSQENWARRLSMRRKKNSAINDVIHRYSRKAARAKLTIRKLNRDTVLIEGNSNSLKFLANILLALTNEEDCGFELSPTSEGRAWFAKDAHGN